MEFEIKKRLRHFIIQLDKQGKTLDEITIRIKIEYRDEYKKLKEVLEDFGYINIDRMLNAIILETIKPLEFAKILSLIIDTYGVAYEKLIGKTRKRQYVMPRHVAMYFIKKYTKYTWATIGQEFGNRDHSTVIHAIEAVQNSIETEPQFKREIERLDLIIKEL